MFLAFHNNSLKSISSDCDHTGLLGALTVEDKLYIFPLGNTVKRFFLDPLSNWKSNFGLGDKELERGRGGEYLKGLQTITAVTTMNYKHLVTTLSRIQQLSRLSQTQRALQEHAKPYNYPT